MALDPNILSQALAQADLDLLREKFEANGAVLGEEFEQSIIDRADAYATAIHAWILTATVNTNVTTTSTTSHAPGTIDVEGNAFAQSNPSPVVGTASGTGTGIGTLS
jgi:hypothetical protein